MKVFQIVDGRCHYDATKLHASLADIPAGIYPPALVFAEAPDYVREGWGYDPAQEGDARFTQPPLPEPSQWSDDTGQIFFWRYSVESGTFFIAYENGDPVSPEDLERAIEAMSNQPPPP